MSQQRSRALHAALMGGGHLNGVRASDLLPVTADRDPRSICSEDVVVIRERNPVNAASLAFRAWEHGAVPLLSSSDLPDRHWWQAGRHSFVIQGGASEWNIPDSCGLLQMTSGSSGVSKMVMRGVDSILWESRSYDAALGESWRSGTFANSVDFSHSLGWGLTMSGLISGCDVVAASPRDLHLLHDRWHEHSVIGTTPALLDLLLRTRPTVENLEGVVLFVGAGALTEETRSAVAKAWPSSHIVTGFGCTETGGIATGTHGIGELNDGVTLIDANTDSRPFHLKVRMPHEVMGYAGANNSGRYEWEFPDLVEQDSRGQLRHVARISELPRRNQKTPVTVEFSEYMSSIGREWRIVELSGSRSCPKECTVLVVESGRDGAVNWSRLLMKVRDLLDIDLFVLQVYAFPRNDIGKVVYSSLLKLVEDRADELRDTLIEPDRTADRTRALAYMHRIAKARFPLIAQLDLDEFARSALSECGVDSLGVMELVIAIQGETGRMLPDSLLMSQNVDSPINWVEALYPTGENVEDIENGQESVIWR